MSYETRKSIVSTPELYIITGRVLTDCRLIEVEPKHSDGQLGHFFFNIIQIHKKNATSSEQ